MRATGFVLSARNSVAHVAKPTSTADQSRGKCSSTVDRTHATLGQSTDWVMLEGGAAGSYGQEAWPGVPSPLSVSRPAPRQPKLRYQCRAFSFSPFPLETLQIANRQHLTSPSDCFT